LGKGERGKSFWEKKEGAALPNKGRKMHAIGGGGKRDFNI